MSSPVDKTRLTADQKKQNHIESERKRREAIRSGFEKLSEKVPDSKGKASSEGVVLANTVKYIEDLQAKKEELREKAKKKGMSDLVFEQHYRDIRKNLRAEKDGKEPPSTPASASGPSTSGIASSAGAGSTKSTKVRLFPFQYRSRSDSAFLQTTDIFTLLLSRRSRRKRTEAPPRHASHTQTTFTYFARRPFD